MASGLKFQTWEVEGLHYLSSENKGADQLRCDRSADLLLYFRICKKQVFSCSGSWYVLSFSVFELLEGLSLTKKC